jgi:DDE_Tnp_1-associated
MDQPLQTAILLQHFAALKDPRQLVKVLYPLPEILLLVLCATIAAADDFVEIKHWGETHMDFLRRFLPYAVSCPTRTASLATTHSTT